jgi:hypothetical protein
MTKDEVPADLDFGFETPLQGFKNLNISFIPIFEDIDKIAKRKKFANKFDIIVMNFLSSGVMKEDYLKNMIAKDSVIFVEKAT